MSPTSFAPSVQRTAKASAAVTAHPKPSPISQAHERPVTPFQQVDIASHTLDLLAEQSRVAFAQATAL